RRGRRLRSGPRLLQLHGAAGFVPLRRRVRRSPDVRRERRVPERPALHVPHMRRRAVRLLRPPPRATGRGAPLSIARRCYSRAMKSGGCCCGAVRYELAGELTKVTFCHCSKCRKWHGHFAAYCAIDRPGFRLTEERGLKWYAASTTVRRGFCAVCG